MVANVALLIVVNKQLPSGSVNMWFLTMHGSTDMRQVT